MFMLGLPSLFIICTATVVVVSAVTLKGSRLLQSQLSDVLRSHYGEVDPEVYMDSTQLITSKGYPCENHYVTTQDGFILNMQRIPHGRHQTPKPGQEKPVVILQHGYEGSSSNWLDNLANESLAYLLADAGLTYGWAIWDQMAAFDLPAMVDHVIRTTGVKQVQYVGHSQGTTIGFAGFSINHTLAASIKRFYALAPIAKVTHIKSPIRLLSPFARDLDFAFALLGHNGFMSYNKEIMDFLARDVCADISDILCENVFFVLGGFDRTHLNESRVPVYVGHNPGGSSVQNLVHYAQGVNVDKFQKLDYGSAEANMDHYHQPTPPVYNLTNFHVPVVTYTGGHDILADRTDVEWLLEQIATTLFANYSVPAWEHVDFIWAYDVPEYYYNNLLDWIFNK